IVNGNAGQDAGRGMIGGNLVVKGNASSVGEDMIGGSITVEGECLWSAGCCMRNGTISVMGNTVSVGRDMEGGVIATGSNIEGFSGMGMAGGVSTLNGGAGGNAGKDMIDGLIVIKGDAGKELACGMLGGEIAIDGDCPGLGSAIRGRILQKGETIFDTALRGWDRMSCMASWRRYWGIFLLPSRRISDTTVIPAIPAINILMKMSSGRHIVTCRSGRHPCCFRIILQRMSNGQAWHSRNRA